MKSIINIAFLVIIFGFALNNALRIVYKTDTSENRNFAEKPVMDINNLDKYPPSYDSYINDNFAGRNHLIDFHNWIGTNVFNSNTISDKFLRGKEDYLFEMKKFLPVFTGKKHLADSNYTALVEEFEGRKKALEKEGIKMYVQIFSIKYKIYNNKIPYYPKKSPKNMGSCFVEYFRKNSSVTVIDAEAALLPYRDCENLFYKYDTHWNKLGAFRAHQVLIDSIHKDFPSVPLLDTMNYNIEKFDLIWDDIKKRGSEENSPDFGVRLTPKNQTFSKSNSGFIHKNEKFQYGQNNYYKRYKSSHDDRPKVLIFRDSFSNATLSFLPESFSEVVYIWDNWNYRFNKDIIDIEKPDIVIYSINESFISNLLRYPTFVDTVKD